MDNLAQCYQILELKEGTPLSEVERAHRELSRVWHPDRFAGDTLPLQERAQDKQQQINAAYERLAAHLATAGAETRLEARPAVTPARCEAADVAVPPASASPLRRVTEVLTEYVAPVLRDVVVPALVRRVTGRAPNPDRDGTDPGDSPGPVRQRARDGRGGGCGGGRGSDGGGRANGSGRGRGGRRGQ